MRLPGLSGRLDGMVEQPAAPDERTGNVTVQIEIRGKYPNDRRTRTLDSYPADVDPKDAKAAKRRLEDAVEGLDLEPGSAEILIRHGRNYRDTTPYRL